ncbi:putative truncated DNA recombinase [Brevibacillus brevis NBRC 100599]|uniref:Putative truncated DNA recombinase n=1 Tax=Brevibacillus brevis (strain 47 / JCM 6285 / NBRC 100599) TaxID=358681 RepID=C0ZAU0_BREBN|nr:putative truncated DNA recombinase [Brevibacillus brevis NBRC 100599]
MYQTSSWIRPALSRLRQDVKDGVITQIVCLDPDRLSPKLMNQLLITDEFDKRGIELVFVNGKYAKTPEGQLFYRMRGAITQFQKVKINERMSRGRREKARPRSPRLSDIWIQL